MKPILVVMCLAIAGCGAQPVPYHSGNEIPRGPGLLSGAKGEFVVRFDNISTEQSKERDYQD